MWVGQALGLGQGRDSIRPHPIQGQEILAREQWGLPEISQLPVSLQNAVTSSRWGCETLVLARGTDLGYVFDRTDSPPVPLPPVVATVEVLSPGH